MHGYCSSLSVMACRVFRIHLASFRSHAKAERREREREREKERERREREEILD